MVEGCAADPYFEQTRPKMLFARGGVSIRVDISFRPRGVWFPPESTLPFPVARTSFCEGTGTCAMNC